MFFILSERTNPFYDRTCNNEVLKMQKLGVLDAQLTNMQVLRLYLYLVHDYKLDCAGN